MATKNGIKKKDERYKMVRIVMESTEGFKAFKEIFRLLPKSVLAKDMHMNNNRMQSLIDNPGNFTYNEVNEMAGLIGCKYDHLRDLIEKAAGLATVKNSKAKQQ